MPGESDEIRLTIFYFILQQDSNIDVEHWPMVKYQNPVSISKLLYITLER